MEPYEKHYTATGILYFARCQSCKAMGFGTDGSPQVFMVAHKCREMTK